MSDKLDFICTYYRVPAKRGGRIEYTDSNGVVRTGEIRGADGAHLVIRLDGETHCHNYHPTWNIKYLEAAI